MILKCSGLMLQPSVLDGSIASGINVGEKAWCHWPEKVFSLYLGNIKQDLWLEDEPKQSIFDVSWRSKVEKKGPNEWKNVDKIIPKTLFEQEPSDS